MYHTLDYLVDKDRHYNYIKAAPVDQYQKNSASNAVLKQDENASHALKTPQPIRKSRKKVRTLRRNRMSLQDLAQNYPINGSVKDVNDTDLLRRIIKKIEDYRINNE